ncbi:TPA: hypothetical protein ACT2FD_000406 [Streptococcus suis]
MNKRQKKKYVLENRIRILETHIDFLVNQKQSSVECYRTQCTGYEFEI